MAFRVRDSGFWVLGLAVLGSGFGCGVFKVRGSGFRVLRFIVCGFSVSRCGVSGSGFRVSSWQFGVSRFGV